MFDLNVITNYLSNEDRNFDLLTQERIPDLIKSSFNDGRNYCLIATAEESSDEKPPITRIYDGISFFKYIDTAPRKDGRVCSPYRAKVLNMAAYDISPNDRNPFQIPDIQLLCYLYWKVFEEFLHTKDENYFGMVKKCALRVYNLKDCNLSDEQINSANAFNLKTFVDILKTEADPKNEFKRKDEYEFIYNQLSERLSAPVTCEKGY